MAKPSRSKLPLIAVVVTLVVVGLLLVPWLLRHTIATSIAVGELEQRHIVCDDRFAVEVSSTMGSGTVGPTRCERSTGLIEAFELLGPGTVELSALNAESIRLDSVRLVLRDSDVRGGSSWASELSRLQLEQKVASLLKGISELAALDLPPTTVISADVVRGRHVFAQARQLTLTDEGESLAITVEGISFGTTGAQLELNGVEGTASPSSVHLEGVATARIGVMLFGSMSRTSDFEVHATGLDTASPDFSLDAAF